MKTSPRHIALILMLTLSCIGTTIAQSGFYVPKDGKVFFTTDSATIFSNVLNQGKLGIGKNASVSFMGKQWENDSQSLITDETNGGEGANGTGGVVRFLSTDMVPQQLVGGYNAASRVGPAFSNIEIQSKGGVILSGSNAKVRNELTLIEGLVYVKDNILLIGEGTPGKITGYDSTRFIVTDNTQQGFLLRENISNEHGMIVFPVGSKANAYTPAGIRSKSNQPDNYYVNVADGVKGQIFRPNLVEEGVNKTWKIGKQNRPGQDEVVLTLEHLNKDEGSFFASNRHNSHISQDMRLFWDDGNPKSMPEAGRLTTGNELTASGDNSRTFSGSISTSSYFTKFTGKGDSSKTNLWFNGYRLDTSYARVYWRTNPEINNKYFVVQRRLSTESGFTNVDIVLSKAINGSSYSNLEYEIKDFNKYHGVSYYRLLLVDKFNDTTYSEIIAVAGLPGKHKLTVWPNPTPNKFYVDLNREVNVKTIVIWNAIGQKLRQEEVNGRPIMEFGGFIPGTYMVGFISTQGYIIETKKVVVIGY